MAGAALFPSLAAMAEVDEVGTLLLTGTAGAVIGAGTSLGIFRFGNARPTLAQAAWYTNVVAWGALAGLKAWSVTEDESPKVRFGLLAAGQVLGLGLGAWSASRFDFTPAQTVLADSVVLAASLASAGGDLVRDQPIHGSRRGAIATVPIMVGAAWLGHEIDPSPADLRLIGFATPTLGLSGGLLAAGLLERSALSRPAVGGAALGLSAGYLGATLLSPLVEIDPAHTAATTVGVVAGDGVGLGLHMLFAPERSRRWPLGAAIGGLAGGTATALLYPRLHPGPSWPAMTSAGAAYTGGSWLLAALAGAPEDGQLAQVGGGLLSGTLLGGAGGLIASEWFRPTAVDQLGVFAATSAGVATGLGAVRLAVDRRGTADSVGVMAGAAGGLALGAFDAHLSSVTVEDGLGYVLGGGVGAFAGTLIPTLGDEVWSAGRATEGGALAGAGLGALAGVSAVRLVDASAGQIAAAAVGGGLGTTLGLGIGLMAPDDGDSHEPRVGALAGQLGLMAATIAVEPWLHLGDGLGADAGGLTVFGVTAGAAYGSLATSLVSPATPHEGQVQGGMMAGASAGVATGLVLSRWFRPTLDDYAVAGGGSVLGHELGLGVTMLAVDDPDPDRQRRIDGAGRLLGGVGGLLAGGLVARATETSAATRNAALVGAGYGGLIGALAPSLADDAWHADRRAGGGANLGVAIGGAAAAAAAHLGGATNADVAVPALGAALGGGLGLGVGLLADPDLSQGGRVGFTVGTLGLGVGAGLAAAPLRLTTWSPSRGRMTASGGGLGVAYGLLLGEALDDDVDDGIDDRLQTGGFLAGGSAGVAAGVVLSRWFAPSPADHWIAHGGAVLGAGVGVGLSHLAFEDYGRADATLALGGSILGLGAAALVQRTSPLEPSDAWGASLGAGFGGLIGTLAPTLGAARWSGFDRRIQGGLELGGAAGALAGVGLVHATGASDRAIGLTALGGGHGLATGLGLGMLLDDDASSQARRIGVVAGSGAGLALGALWLPRVTLTEGDRWLVGAGTAVSGWTGALAPLIGHADWTEVDGARVQGGALAGAGLGSLAAVGLASRIDVDPARIHKALALDAIFSVAGLGAGALATTRDDGPLVGALAGGTGGLVLGAALADHIRFDASRAPLYSLAVVHGTWFGAFAPRLLDEDGDATGRAISGGVAAGAFGGLGLAALAGDRLALTPAEAGKLGLASSIGTSIAGGAALIGDELPARGRIGLMLGGTTAGLALGAGLMPAVELDARAQRMAAVGGLLGASEGLAFAWAGRGQGSEPYWGAALVGGGLGTTLGLAGSSAADFTAQRALVASGFGAWGGWIGSFSGAMVDTDPRSIVLGGLAGGNLGLGAGALLTQTGVFRAEDFGWLSLAGAVGTVGGAGVGALFSTREDRRPIFAGLAVGPVAGMASGALMLPVLRKLGGRPSSGLASSRARPGGAAVGRGRARGEVDAVLAGLFDVTEWQPMFGALPSLGLSGDAPPIGGGVSGTLE